jgi:hypothetical protein
VDWDVHRNRIASESESLSTAWLAGAHASDRWAAHRPRPGLEAHPFEGEAGAASRFCKTARPWNHDSITSPQRSTRYPSRCGTG